MALKGLFADTGLARLRLQGREVSAQVAKAVESAVLTRTIEGASNIALTLGDVDYELIRSQLFNSRMAANLDGLVFELAGLNKAGTTLTLTVEDGLVADLRRKRGPGPVARAGTTTRTNFARRLVSEVKYAKFRGEPGPATRVAISRGGKHGGGKRENSWDALVRLASDRAWRCFVDEETVYFGSDAWLLGLRAPTVINERTEGVDRIDWDYDTGKQAQTATIACWLKRWAAQPGWPVRIEGQGELTNGLYLVQTISRSLYSQQGTVNLVRKTPELPEPKPSAERHDDSEADGTGGGHSSKGVSNGWQWPADGPISSDYGAPRSYGGHSGIDIAVPVGTPIWAARDGYVVFAGELGGYGNCIDIDHGSGLKTRYAHLNGFKVRSGHDVKRGQVIALSGNSGATTGAHLHFGTYRNGVPFDPKTVLP